MTILNRCLNSQAKIYGLKSLGVVVAVLFGILASIYFSALVGVGFAGVGYFVGAQLGNLWHIGTLQKLMYWHLPVSLQKKCPKSHLRIFR
jgi:hypothetical protein